MDGRPAAYKRHKLIIAQHDRKWVRQTITAT